ncbi:MAG: tRNA pseudouridine32 synthase/23S rRNA pseudouridine746 synthase [Bacteriovoracaceae bacterium]
MSYITIFENEKFIIIAKNPGIEFHGDGGIIELLRKDFPEIHGVHRLDKATSGLMLFAKDKGTQSELSKLFQSKKVQKIYIAISDKKPNKKQGLVKGDLEKTRNGSYKITRNLLNPSTTKFKSFYSPEFSLRGFYLFPMTGKTHQLRVVLKSIGAPILGDIRYGGTHSDRMYLHAFSLKFELKGELFEFENYPELGDLYLDMKKSFEDYRDLEKL